MVNNKLLMEVEAPLLWRISVEQIVPQDNGTASVAVSHVSLHHGSPHKHADSPKNTQRHSSRALPARAIPSTMLERGKAPCAAPCSARWQQSAHPHVDLSARQAGPESSLPATSSSDLCLSENVHINKLYVCSYCHKSFTVRTKLTTHLRIHTGERPFQCHLCPLAFTQKAHLVYHVRTHTGERPFQCRFCPKAFARKLRRKHHEISEHWRKTTAP
ncbi:zinc finger protein 8-like [Dermacentor albipictus]|uniref:zinc finger protein 8-like n=1 Tax=Dermacentor albipictus TaxID=60249 RepID=UPI0031FD7855